MVRSPPGPQYELNLLQSREELRALAAEWDALWWRSESIYPTARADATAQCCEQFAPRERSASLTVSRGGRLLAALPLVGMRIKKVLTVGKLPGSAWTPGGDLLLDPDCDTAAVLDVLVAGLRRVPWPLVWIEAAQTQSSRWHGMELALQRAGLATLTQQRYQVGQFSLGADWESYERSWSRNHRRAMRRALQAAENWGRIALEFYAPPRADQIEPILRRGFAVEDASWKGAAGSSVLRNRGIFEFFLRQARLIAAWDQLSLALLTLDGQAIAFEYAFSAKGTYAPLKVGYDPRFAALKPGQLLRWHLFRALAEDRRWVGVDFVGPINDATARWSSSSYPLCRLVIAPRRSGKLLLAGYRLARGRQQVSQDVRLLPGAVAEPSGAAAD